MTLEELLALLPDNTTGDISAADMRTIVTDLWTEAYDTADEDALAAHLADAVSAHLASAVAFTPGGSVAATDVQAAILEVASEYAAAIAALNEVSSGLGITVGPSSGGFTPIAVEALTYARAVPQYVRATANQTVNNSTTLVNDAALTLPVDANGVYDLAALFVYSSSTVAKAKVKFDAPAGATLDWVVGGLGSTATTSIGGLQMDYGALANAQVLGGVGTGAECVARPRGILAVGSTAGSLTLQWAQNAAEATDTVRHAGSTLILRRLA